MGIITPLATRADEAPRLPGKKDQKIAWCLSKLWLLAAEQNTKHSD